MHIYKLITWYGKLKKQQRLSVNVSMRWDVLWLIPCSIYGIHQEVKEIEHLEATLAGRRRLRIMGVLGMQARPRAPQARP